MNTWTQRSFAGGEVSPAIAARADMVKYQTGLALCSNMFVQRWGGVSNRSGGRWVGEVKTSAKKVRVIPFVFDIAAQFWPSIILSNNYLLELGDYYMRVHQVGLRTFEDDWAITNILNSNPCQLTVPGHSLIDGDEIAIALVGGMTELNDRYFKVANVFGNNFTLKHMGDGVTDVDATGFGAYTSGGLVGKVLEFVTPWSEDEIFQLHFKQAGDILRVTHPSHPVYEIRRTATTPILQFTVLPATFGASVTAPGAPTAAGGGAGTYTYKVTAIRWDPWSESLASPVSNTVGKAAPATPVTVTLAAPVAGADEYNVYREQNGAWFWVGVMGDGLTFEDEGGAPDFTGQPPEPRLAPDGNPFLDSADNYPSTLCYYQQRLLYASSNNEPAKVMGSRSGEFQNFNLDVPTRDDSPVTFELTGPQMRRVRHMVDIGRLVIFTDTGEFVAEGDAAGVLTPFDINLRQEGYFGASELPPIVANGSIIYVQARGDIIREFAYQFEVDGYRGNDLTVFADHLFTGHTIKDWCFAQAPHPILWVARANGTLLGMTYMREQAIWGWHQHHLGGGVESVAVVPEMDAISGVSTDVLYCVVNRTVPGLAGLGGEQRRYIERIAPKSDSDVDGVYVDSAKSWYGRNGYTANTVKITNGVTWQRGEAMSVVANGAYFDAGLVGSQIWVFGLDTDGITLIRVYCTVTAYTSPTQVEVLTDRDVPVALRDFDTFAWSVAIDELGGLWHLEGKDVSVLGSGKVLANPLNPEYDIVTVADGKVQLDNFSDVIHVGLPFTSQIQTLDLDYAGEGDAAVDKRKLANRVAAIVQNTRGLWAGSNEKLDEFKIRDQEDYDYNPTRQTGKITVNCLASWGYGRVRIVQIDPLPCTILGVVPSGMAPIGMGG